MAVRLGRQLALGRRVAPPRLGRRGSIGHGPSSGTFHGDAVCDPGPGCDQATGNIQELSYLAKQDFEVKKAADYMFRLRGKDGKRLIDRRAVAIMGHSFGGMVTIFANGELTLHRAA